MSTKWTIDRSVIYEYEEYLIGNRKTMNQNMFNSGKVTNEAMALAIMDYAFRKYLRWHPVEIRDRIDRKLLDMLKLTRLVKFIPFPEELNPKSDYFFIVWRLYPETVNYTYEERVYHVYKQVLSGQATKFPKEYYSGEDGYERAILCFRYMIENRSGFHTIPEMYEYFSTNKGFTMLKKNKLWTVCRDLFITPLDYLHESLPDCQKNEILYGAYKLKQLMKE